MKIRPLGRALPPWAGVQHCDTFFTRSLAWEMRMTMVDLITMKQKVKMMRSRVFQRWKPHTNDTWILWIIYIKLFSNRCILYWRYIQPAWLLMQWQTWCYSPRVGWELKRITLVPCARLELTNITMQVYQLEPSFLFLVLYSRPPPPPPPAASSSLTHHLLTHTQLTHTQLNTHTHNLFTHNLTN